MTVWPFIFVREDERYNERIERHECIHGEQQEEMLIILFFLWYCTEWLIRLVLYWDRKKAYRSISFEREAYENEHNPLYLEKRKHYSWIKYLFRQK